MCEAEKSGWRVDVGHTVAVIQKLNRNPYADRAWVEVARIPLDDAVEMAATLMRHLKRPLPTLHAVERAICCPSGRCSSPGDCYADDRSRIYPVHIRDAAEAVLRLVGDGWRPIAEAPTERGAVVDLWVRSKMTEVTGRGYRIADCHPDGKGSWLHQGQWVTGRHFFDEDGERCFDPYDTSRDATVATHFRMKPGGPLEAG